MTHASTQPTTIPESLNHEQNQTVIAFLADKSARDEVVDALAKAVQRLGDVDRFCPDLATYRYLAIHTRGTIIAFASGMNIVGFRLNPADIDKAIATGAETIPSLPGWIAFRLFRSDWPEFDLRFWATRAYGTVRESSAASDT